MFAAVNSVDVEFWVVYDDDDDDGDDVETG